MSHLLMSNDRFSIDNLGYLIDPRRMTEGIKCAHSSLDVQNSKFNYLIGCKESFDGFGQLKEDVQWTLFILGWTKSLKLKDASVCFIDLWENCKKALACVYTLYIIQASNNIISGCKWCTQEKIGENHNRPYCSVDCLEYTQWVLLTYCQAHQLLVVVPICCLVCEKRFSAYYGSCSAEAAKFKVCKSYGTVLES